MDHGGGVKVKKRWIGVLVAVAMLIGVSAIVPTKRATSAPPEVEGVVRQVFETRAKALLHGGKPEVLVGFYADRQDRAESITGQQLLGYEQDKIREFHEYAAKLGMKYTDVQVTLKLADLVESGSAASVHVTEGLQLSYVYPQSQNPTAVNTFGLKIEHDVELERTGNTWKIVRDSYIDPFRAWLSPDHRSPRASEVEGNVGLGNSGQSNTSAEDVGITATYYYDGQQAAVYADTYCGAPGCGNSEAHNNSEYADEPDDCTNFVSQALGDSSEGGKAPQSSPRNYNTNWYYDYPSQTGSIAWVRANSLVNFLTNHPSGSAYNYGILYARGNYSDVTKSPTNYVWHMYHGDVFGYDWPSPSTGKPDGTVDHTAVVAAWDSNGYPLVDAHNTDRFHAPWSLGMASSTTQFTLVRMKDLIKVP